MYALIASGHTSGYIFWPEGGRPSGLFILGRKEVKMPKKKTQGKGKSAMAVEAKADSGEVTQVRVATIWRNQTKAGKPWFSLVLDTGERLASFDPGVIFLAGGDPKKKVNNFNPPAVLEGRIVEKGGFKHFELLDDDRPKDTVQLPPTPAHRSDDDAISRMSILRTAAMLLEYEKNKSMKRFQELVKLCENYVFFGRLE